MLYWCSGSGTGALAVALWRWFSGAMVLVGTCALALVLWRWSSGTGPLVLELCAGQCGAGNLVLVLRIWCSVARALALVL